ncbi:MAG: hypothetical protein OXI26_01760 [bacterium]|nr:hypothetical protein [bacterium]
MAVRVRCERVGLLLIALAHLGFLVTHDLSHSLAGVPTSPTQLVLIVAVMTVLPILAVAMAFHKSPRLGAGLFAVAMAASFGFGYLLHFVLGSPELHSNVAAEHRDLFFHSAQGLAHVEVAGVMYGFAMSVRRRQQEPDRGSPNLWTVPDARRSP